MTRARVNGVALGLGLAGAAACAGGSGDDAATATATVTAPTTGFTDGGASSAADTTDASAGGDAGTTGASTTGSGGASDTSTTDASTTDASASGDASTGLTTATTGMEEGECDYVQVVDMPGPVHWVTEDAPVLEVAPLAAGEGFYCVRVEFDLQTLDNLDALQELAPELCPEYLAIASVFGTTARGEDLATSFLRVMDRDGEACTVGDTRLEVGNYLNYTADTAGPWPLGEAWHVVLEAKPWVTRISLAQGEGVVGPVVEASLYPANVADTRDPRVRLGLPMIAAGKFFPWYGATYANLAVWADVAPPP